MDERLLHDAEKIREQILRQTIFPEQFRAALLQVPYVEKDAWVNAVLGLDECAEDGPELPRGCVPYLPCPVDALVRIAECVPVQATDVLIDIGSGVGRAAALMHLLTGATCIGIEVQSAHVAQARALAERLRLSAVTFVPGDAAEMPFAYAAATVFFLYCPFSGPRLERFLSQIEKFAQQRQISICTVDLPLPEMRWFAPSMMEDDLRIYRSRIF